MEMGTERLMDEHWGGCFFGTPLDGILPYVGFLIDFFSNGEDILFRVVVDFEFFFGDKYW